MNIQRTPPVVLVTGNNTRLISSLAVCLILGGSKVIVHGKDNKKIKASIYSAIHSYYPAKDLDRLTEQLKMTGNMHEAAGATLAILLTSEDRKQKRSGIRMLEQLLEKDQLITCNTESIDLKDLQEGAINPARILGANWVDPVYTSCFLEIITTSPTKDANATAFSEIAKSCWGKDPYIVHAGYSVRSRLMCAILREAFFLIENKYANAEDIDRACRNDAGFYLAFAGNFRYMDLMGLYAYGVVMGNLNPELSRAEVPPGFFIDMVKRGDYGMHSRRGFFEYQEEDVIKWETAFETFSREIEKIIKRYPLVHNPSRSPDA